METNCLITSIYTLFDIIHQFSIFTSFKANESIPFAYNQTVYTGIIGTTTTALRENESGVMKLPSSIYSAACDDINVLGFLFDIPFNQKLSLTSNGQNNQCEIRYNNLQAACTTESRFNLNSYIGTEWLGRSMAATPSQPTSYVNVVLSNLTSIDLYTGVATSNISTALPLPAPTLASVSPNIICENVVVGVTYYVYANVNGLTGAITSDVEAHVTIAEQVIESSANSIGAVPVQYEVIWKDQLLQDANPGSEVNMLFYLSCSLSNRVLRIVFVTVGVCLIE